MSNPNPPNKFKKGEPRPAGAGRRPGAVNHLTTARVKTERKVRVVYQTVGSPPALERLFIASTHGWERGIVAGPESTGHGLQCFGVGVERRDILRRYTSAALR